MKVAFVATIQIEKSPKSGSYTATRLEGQVRDSTCSHFIVYPPVPGQTRWIVPRSDLALPVGPLG